MRVIKGEMRGAKSGGGVTLLRRISTETVAHSFNSGELLRQPGGTVWRGGRGNRRGERGHFIGAGAVKKQQGN
jgi:hypothetical protein